ncbi:FAS1 domain-containing protein [Daedaleopsis nitida]|nr:FAS1 domain-containing protein [Daedaleopsis nitida]
MKFSLASSIALASIPAAFAQDANFLTGLLDALTSSGHTQLVGAAAKLNSSSAGQSVLSQLSSGTPFLVFAPTDQAFGSLPSNVSSNVDALTDVIAYHIVSGNFTGVTSNYPNVSLGHTLLSDPNMVQLEGGQHQVVAWATRADGKVHVLNQLNDSTVTNTTTYQNITINTVDHVLNIPESFADTVPVINASLANIQTALQGASVPFFNSSTNQTTTESFFDILNTGLHGFTFFAPNNSAVLSAAPSLATLLSNQTAVLALFQNHLINGSTVYSPQLDSQNQTSAAGEPIGFSRNATGQYVTSGNVTALIVQPDVLLPNGVIHIIDRVLVNTDTDSAAASSA